jgi:hemerythrin superfamily protein
MDLDSALENKPAEGAPATEVLRADHREVERLFDEYDRAGTDAHARHAVMQALCMQLELHDRLEREVFYPAIRALDDALVDRAAREHEEVMKLVANLRERDRCDADCDAFVSRVKSLVENHVTEEEQTLFPRVEQKDAASLRELGTRIVKHKEALTRSTEEFAGPAT